MIATRTGSEGSSPLDEDNSAPQGQAVSPLTAEIVVESLLTQNYLPQQASDRHEVPPSVTSVAFTPAIAAQLSARGARPGGYDAAGYGLTRFDLTLRRAQIPHPLPYSRLVHEIGNDWNQLAIVADNQNSTIRPMLHDDGRIVIMTGYDASGLSETLDSRIAHMRLGKKYQVRTDVKNFFPSIYTHSIPWAAVGVQFAKRNRGSGLWFNQLDARLRSCRRGETSGIAIGPGSSNVFAELLLGSVDQALRAAGHEDFIRYIDDYEYYAETEESGRRFIEAVQKHLARFELQLNDSKTAIRPLPMPMAEAWVRRLTNDDPGEDASAAQYRAYLGTAIELSAEQGVGSAIQYAAGRLRTYSGPASAVSLLAPELIGVAEHRPRVFPTVVQILEACGVDLLRYSESIEVIVCEAIRRGRSDILAWGLHALMRSNSSLADEIKDLVIESRDGVAMALVCASGQLTHEETDRMLSVYTSTPDDYARDQLWIVGLELAAVSDLRLADGLELLSDAGVSFVDRDVLRGY